MTSLRTGGLLRFHLSWIIKWYSEEQRCHSYLSVTSNNGIVRETAATREG